VYPKVSGLSHNEINNNNNNNNNDNEHLFRSNTKVMAAKLTRLTHKIAIQLHLVAESCTIYSSRSRRPVRELLDTPAYKTTPSGKTFISFNTIDNKSMSMQCARHVALG
jgi:hypothetical protein